MKKSEGEWKLGWAKKNLTLKKPADWDEIKGKRQITFVRKQLCVTFKERQLNGTRHKYRG